MEVWALEAYGASHILQEMLTVKSDDVIGRYKTFDAIVNGDRISEASIPESFKVLLKELQACGLDMRVLTENNEEISLRELTEETDEVPASATGNKFSADDEVIDLGSDELPEDFEFGEEEDIFGDDLDDFESSEEFNSSELFDDFGGDDDFDDFSDDEM